MKEDVSQSRCPHQARRTLRKATETPAGTLRRVKAPLAQMGADSNCWPGYSPGERSKEQVLMKAPLELAQMPVGESRLNLKKVLWSDETKLFGHQTRQYAWRKQMLLIATSTAPLGGAQWRHHQALEMLLSRSFWEAHQDRGSMKAETYQQILEDHLAQTA